MLSSHVVSCGSAICPIMASTASVAMKPRFGVKPGRFYLRSTIWIAANHMRECGEAVCSDLKNFHASLSDAPKPSFNTMGPPPRAASAKGGGGK
jgi:hypothetical protein